MAIIHYKYIAGDKVKFKDKFVRPTCGLAGREGELVEITGLALAYNNQPHYYINNEKHVVYPESVFAGLAPKASKNTINQTETLEVDISQGPETECDKSNSGESDDSVKYRELYLKALKKIYGKVPFETETVEVGSLLEFTEAVLKATKEV